MPSRSRPLEASSKTSRRPRPLLARFSGELSAIINDAMRGVVALSGVAGEYQCSGSGFIIDSAGHVVTNAHVVENMRPPIEALAHGGSRHPAALIGVDPLTDLALLRLEKPPRHHLEIRRAHVALGEMCMALGNPYGRYPETVSLGIVSGVARTVYQEIGRPIYGSLQMDCAVSPGNSGGPLIDVQGAVIGVTVRKDQQADNVGFAIPADTVREVVAELMASGEVKRASLGVSVKKGTASLDGHELHGVEVVEVPSVRSSSFKPGDLIIRIARTPVRDVTDVVRLLTADRIGKALAVQVVRRGRRFTLTIKPSELRP